MFPAVLPVLEGLKLTKLAELRPFMKNINCKVIVLKRLEEKPTKDNQIVVSLRVADESGSCILTLWNELGTCTSPADILLISGGFVTMFQNEIRLGCRLGAVLRVGRFAMQFLEAPDHSGCSWIADKDDPMRMVKQELDGKRPASRSKREAERNSKDPRTHK